MLTNFNASQYKHLSTPPFTRWSMLQHEWPMALPSLTERQPETKLWTCLKPRWLTSRLAWAYELCFVSPLSTNTTLQNDTITGEISLTCDAWQASNTDRYFAVTGHWIEESWPGVWEIQSALLGFTRLNNAHNGKQLGGALFKIVDWLGIAHRVWILNYFEFTLMKHII